MVDGPSLRQEAMLRFARPQSYFRRNTSLILFIGVLFFAIPITDFGVKLKVIG